MVLVVGLRFQEERQGMLGEGSLLLIRIAWKYMIGQYAKLKPTSETIQALS